MEVGAGDGTLVGTGLGTGLGAGLGLRVSAMTSNENGSISMDFDMEASRLVAKESLVRILKMFVAQ